MNLYSLSPVGKHGQDNDFIRKTSSFKSKPTGPFQLETEKLDES